MIIFGKGLVFFLEGGIVSFREGFVSFREVMDGADVDLHRV